MVDFQVDAFQVHGRQFAAVRRLRHTNISTTQRYMHLDERELAEAQDLVD